MATVAGDRRAVLLRGEDNVAVAARPIPKGFELSLGGRDGLRPGASAHLWAALLAGKMALDARD